MILIVYFQIGGKRPRMPSTSAQPPQQPSNLAEIIDRLQREISEGSSNQAAQNLFAPRSSQGPIIADVTDELESGVVAGPATPAAIVPATVVSSPPVIAPQVPANPISLSPSLDRQISEELAEYLSGQEQTIDNCRDLLGSYWDGVMADEAEDEEPRQQQQQLMLESGDPMLALDDAPSTPDLLTPLASPSNDQANR